MATTTSRRTARAACWWSARSAGWCARLRCPPRSSPTSGSARTARCSSPGRSSSGTRRSQARCIAGHPEHPSPSGTRRAKNDPGEKHMRTSSAQGPRGAGPNLRPARGSIAAAVCCALYGSPPALAADPTDNSVLQEVTVTASRRQESLESVPYSVSVVTPEQIEASGATDIATLATTVPGLSMYDYGARFAGATAPIIRGINATGSPARGFRTFEQDPVGTYIGNSPIEGYFQLDDVSRIEVLKGPQGTLYGAGALGGALRLIPNAPKLGVLEGSIEASGDRVAHSEGTGYSVRGSLNVPIGDTLAIRAAGKYAYQPGWIRVFGPEERTNNGLYGTPLLAT